MTSQYGRSASMRASDFHQSKDFEQQVAPGLGEFLVDYSSSTDKIDFWVPGFYLDVKEKRQKLTERWHLLSGVPEEHLVVLDELGTRKLMQHFPYGYFLIRDVPSNNRLFLASATELCSVERARVNRWTSSDKAKGKLVYDLRHFRPISQVADVYQIVMQDLVDMPWKQSPCVGEIEPGRV
jgi:hypothetical protein